MDTSKSTQTTAEKLVSFMIASVTVLAAFITYMQTYSSGKGNEADRISTKYAIQAMAVKSSGQTRVSHDWQGAFQTWYELDTQASAEDLAGDTAAAARYRAVRDHIVNLDSIFIRDYYDSSTDYAPNVSKYEADVYIVESTRLSERFTEYNKVSDAWGNRSRAFIVHLTMLAVALSLLGLSITIHGFMRGMFIALATLIAGVVVLWSFIVMLTPLPVVNDQAIDAFAQGVGKSWYGDSGGAIQEFDSALASDPGYANAMYERGNAYYYQQDYQNALTNYEAAIRAGRDDSSVGWNLGWVYYMVGRYDDAIAMDQHVLNLDSSLIGVRFNLALAQMAKGDFAAAEREYRTGVERAVAEVTGAHETESQPPSSFWYYMDASTRDLESLMFVMDGNPKPWSEAPGRDIIPADPTQLRDLGSRILTLLKDTTVALEFTGQAPPAAPQANFSAFEFGQREYDGEGNIVNYALASTFERGINNMSILFDYSGMTPGASEIWKVYFNGVEDPTLRVLGTWGLDESGQGEKLISYAYSNLFIFASGEYTVELYIDSHLVQRGTFTVQ